MRNALVPGTFDPITNGHIDIIIRASNLFDNVVVAVAKSDSKRPLFSFSDRYSLVKDACIHIKNVSVKSYDCLLVDFARQNNINCVVRGLRVLADFEYEFSLAAINKKLDSNIETCLLMSPPEYMYLSSSTVRELALMGGNYHDLVPECVDFALSKKFTSK